MLGSLDRPERVRLPSTDDADEGTNLLGLVKHLAGVELAYLGDCVGHPAPVTLPWVEDESIWENAVMWATADQSRAYLVDLYKTAWRHSDNSIAQLGLDAPASVSWWPQERRSTTFGHLLVRTVAETAHHVRIMPTSCARPSTATRAAVATRSATRSSGRPTSIESGQPPTPSGRPVAGREPYDQSRRTCAERGGGRT